MLGTTAQATSLTGAALLTGYLAAVRPRLRRWGATEVEVAARLPGDDVIPNATGGSTMATTINAPAATIWPWLVQMGCGRAGWYSWDRLDNAGQPSARRILPELQHLAVGDQLPSTPDGRTWFEVAALTPGRVLILRASIDARTGRAFDPRGQRPRFFVDSTWGFFLDEQPGGGTRVLVRTRGTGQPRLLQKLSDIGFWEPAHVIMQTRQFSELRRRAYIDGPADRNADLPPRTERVPHNTVASTSGAS